jgi:hypothetical protein
MRTQQTARTAGGPLTRTLAAMGGLATAAALTGCGDGGGEGSGAPVTVTVRPTVTASAKPEATKTTRPAPKATSDVRGRAYDFGTATKVADVGGTAVLTLDRWTWKRLSDEKLARQGVPLGAFKGTPYVNQNSRVTYAIPLTEGTRILLHHCNAAGEPLQTRSATAEELTGLAEREQLLLVRLDDQGRAVAIDNLPGCPR